MPSFKQTNQLGWPHDVGILAMEVYFPSQYVCQSELEEFDGESKGKYTIGLGQSAMGFCSDREDIISICLTVMTKLMESTNLGYNDIGFLEVGTETIVDKSKSVKTVLMQLFEESGNNDVEGVDTTNACYGGTAALFNAINWIESSAWDGRNAVVIAGDIAVYPKGSVRPTGGAGAIAMLIGPNAPLVFERGLRASDMRHSYDFYKPDFQSEYPTLDGKLSVQCYFKALDNCYQLYLKKASSNRFGSPFVQSLEDIDLMAFHTPFCKLVQKSFARLVLNDFFNCSIQDLSKKYSGLENFRGKTLEETYSDKEVEKTFMKFSAQTFEEKTKSSLLLASQIGNMYTPSLYAGLSSILASFTAEHLAGKRIGMFSYGSGQAASMFSIRVSNDSSVNSPLSRIIASALKVKDRLSERYKVSPHKYTEVMSLRESTHNKASRIPAIDPSAPLFPGTYYLEEVDEKFRRNYKRIPLVSQDWYSCPPTLPNKEAFSSNYTNGHSVESFKVSSS